MRTWDRGRQTMLCGSCGAQIRKGEPFVWVTIPTVEDRKRRCRDCAGEPVPDPFPEPIVSAPLEPTGQQDFFSTRGLARDWKQKQSGGDE